MKLVSTLSILFVLFMSSKANYANPFSNTFRGGAVAANINTASSGLPNFTSANTVAAPQVTTTTTTVNIPAPVAPQVVQQPAVPTGHSHPIPNFGPPPMTPPVSAHSHGPRVALPPQPVPGTPHMHSGHPYIAPAVDPQRMTYQSHVLQPKFGS